MRTSSDKTKFLKALKETPIVFYACRKCGVPRSTIYRWREKNERFRREMDKIAYLGREDLTDMSEMSLIKLIKEGNYKAIALFLAHNSKRYHRRSEIVLTEELKEELKEGECCDKCGQKKRVMMNSYQMNIIGRALSEYRRSHPKEIGELFPE